MDKFAYLIVSISIMAIGFSCKNNQFSGDHPKFKASLDESTFSVFDIFHDVTITPIQTSNECIFSSADKIEIYNDTIFIFDRRKYALYFFNPDGKYINKIHRVGQGPGEYIMVYDFILDHANKSIHLLNPRGSILKYDFNGKFIKNSDLPIPPYNYQYFEMLNKRDYIMWSSTADTEFKALNIVDQYFLKISNGYFFDSSLWGAFRHGSVFHKYKENIYYNETLSNKVYMVTSDDCHVAYEWDMGIQIIDSKKLSAPLNTINEAREKLFEEFQKGNIPFFFGKQFQSEKYCYALLQFPKTTRKSLFYERETGKNWLFEKTVEGISLNLHYMTDDYALGFIEYNDRESLRSVLSKSDMAMLDRMKEDDNPWLVKYTFK